MLKYFLFLVLLSLTGCGDKFVNPFTETTTFVCIDGVEYIKIRTGYRGWMAPHYKADGTLYICDDEYIKP